MKKRFFTVLLLQLAIVFNVLAQEQKKIIDQSDYAGWKNLGSNQLSYDGNWITYEINPQHRGDGWLYLKRTGGDIDSVARGTNASFSPNSNFLVFAVKPEADKVRQARAENTRQDDMPKDSLFIWNFRDMSLAKIERVRSFRTAQEESDWIVYHKDKEKAENDEEEESDEQENERTSEGTRLVVLNPVTNEEFSFENVDNYTFSPNGKLVGMVHVEKDSLEYITVQVFNTVNKTSETIFEGQGETGRLNTDENGNQLTFIFTPDEEDPKVYDLYYWKEGTAEATMVVGADSPGMPEGWSVSENGFVYFSDNAGRLYFGTAPIPEPEPEDTLLSDEKYRLDVWHWKDPYIQPQQLVQRQREQRRTYNAVYHIDRGQMVQLAREDMPDLSTIQGGDGDIALGSSNLPYRILITWSASNYRDYYLVDVNTGEREMILERDLFHTSLSPGGDYLLNYNYLDSCWYAISVDDRTRVNLTGDIPHEFYNILADRPQEPSPYGIAGWVEDDRYVLIYDHHEIWQVDPTGRDNPVNITGGYARANNMRFRYIDLEDEDYIGRRQTMMLDAFNDTNKQSGFYEVRVHRPGTPSRVIMEDARFFRPQKARDADLLAWRRSTFREYSDLWLSDMSFNNARKISITNPQQSEYRWGDVELVEWVSFSKDTLQGLFYTPEGFDPNKKYPMIVYFYERSSNGLHNHQTPSPSRSTINRPHYLSNGYLIFVPDINPYIEGYPAKTSYNSIVSGTKAMINRFGFIDRNNIGLQGQSWGGYKIAHLITETNMFKAAMAGAPVSNMFSAYGGIRWASGRSRQFQYEETQSRIGGTPWEMPLRYIENSPIFFADKVETPLLMMHNDDDGAVPWYQGIEYFMALRRLGSPVWMLNYNDEAHNLRRWPNRIDLDTRMMQFFDHYLKGEPAPVWMEEGIPAVKKGLIDGYEKVE